MRLVVYILILVFVVAGCSSSEKVTQESKNIETEVVNYTADPTIQEEQIIENTATKSSEPIIHVVKKGESLWVIAQKYGVTVKDIVNANNIENASLIKIGQELVIPAKNQQR